MTSVNANHLNLIVVSLVADALIGIVLKDDTDLSHYEVLWSLS
jgi:hypothetical protein